MVNKFEAIGIAASIGAMVLALLFFRLDTTDTAFTELSQTEHSSAVVATSDDGVIAIKNALIDASDSSGNIKKLVVNDIEIGTGAPVEKGDTVTVNYIGTLQNGQEFDNSYRKGTPFTFEVGAGRVIEGWEEGVLGMKEGGKRILVIPPALGYGKDGYGPIPKNATLVFAIELVSIK